MMVVLQNLSIVGTCWKEVFEQHLQDDEDEDQDEAAPRIQDHCARALGT